MINSRNIHKLMNALGDEVNDFLSRPGLLDFIVIILSLIDIMKGPLVIIGLVLWNTKWNGNIVMAVIGSFIAGAYSSYDWIDLSLLKPRIVVFYLGLGGTLGIALFFLVNKFTSVGSKVQRNEKPG